MIAADFIVCNLVLFVFYAYSQRRTFDFEQAAAIAVGVVLCNLVTFAYAGRTSGSVVPWLLRTVGGGALAILVLPYVVALDAGLEPSAIRNAVAFAIPTVCALRIIHDHTRAHAPLETLRLSIIGLGGVVVGFPFLTQFTVGTGDAYWYGNMVGDFVEQWRAGIFPVFVGQSDYAFNGAVTPLRYAPYLQHVAGILDLVTFRTFTNAGLVNLILALSLLAAGFITYLCLASIATCSRWIPCLLALLFITSPAVLALCYAGDLFMSVCTLPYLPLIFFGIWRTFRDQDLRSMCWLAVALAAAWWCHPPIAFWAATIAALSQIIRLGRQVKTIRAWRDASAGAALFTALTLSTFVSVFTLKLPALIAEPRLIVQSLVEAFPGAILPISESGSALSDHQLGWSLWWIFLVGAAASLFRPRGFTATLALGCLGLLALLLPIPWTLNFFWITVLPQAVANITFLWPMQRFYVILAIMTVFLGLVACNRLTGRRRWMTVPIVGLLLAAVHWSASEAVPFLRRGVSIAETETRYKTAQLTENRVLTRYAYSPFPDVPPYFSHGQVDPNWEIRLLDFNSLQETDSNYRFVTGPASTVVAFGEITAKIDAPGARSYVLLRDLPLKSGQHYALEFEFNHPAIAGTLLAEGPTLARNYLLPNSGIGIATTAAPTSFGSLAQSKKSIPLYVSTARDSRLDTVQFWANAPLEHDIARFGRYNLRAYDPQQMPVVVTGWTPFQARASTAAPSWLETPRMYIDGYRANVNGNPVEVRRSPSGLVMTPIPAGSSKVTIDYPGPWPLRFAFYLSLSAWIGVLVLALRNSANPSRDQPTADHSQLA